MAFGKAKLLDYMRSHELVVVASVTDDGGPQSALIGITVTPRHEVIFDTVSSSRKHRNLVWEANYNQAATGISKSPLQWLSQT